MSVSSRFVCRPHSNAFSLIELLVVIAIIAVLAGLLLPALAAAKSSGRSALCKSHLRQHGLALSMYGDDSGVYPIEWADSLVIGQPQFIEWYHALMPYLHTNLQITRCPSAPAQAKFTNMPPKVWQGLNVGGGGGGGIQFIDDLPEQKWRSYGLNCFGSGYFKEFTNPIRPCLGFGMGAHFPPANVYLPSSAVASPANFIAIGDSQADKREDNIIGVISVMGDSVGESWPATRHARGANIVFCDAHVESAVRTNWIIKTDIARARWNYDNQPHRETWGD